MFAAVDKGKQNDAWLTLTDDERAAVEKVYNELVLAYHSDYYDLIRDKIQELDHSTHTLAERMMNTAVSTALKGTKIE